MPRHALTESADLRCSCWACFSVAPSSVPDCRCRALPGWSASELLSPCPGLSSCLPAQVRGFCTHRGAQSPVRHVVCRCPPVRTWSSRLPNRTFNGVKVWILMTPNFPAFPCKGHTRIASAPLLHVSGVLSSLLPSLIRFLRTRARLGPPLGSSCSGAVAGKPSSPCLPCGLLNNPVSLYKKACWELCQACV